MSSHRLPFLTLMLLVAIQLDAATLQCSYVPSLIEEGYFKLHYLHKRISDSIKKQAIEQFFETLDPSKTLLLASDTETLQQSLQGFFKKLKRPDCNPITGAYQVLATRAQENLDFMKKLLADSYVLDETIELILDPKKRSFSKTKEERQEVLRKLAHFQVSNLLLADTKLPNAKKQLIHRYELILKRIQETKVEDQLANFANAFALALDPHSSFLSQSNLEDFQIQMKLSLEGIGASLSNDDGFTIIEDLIAGGSAERTGTLQPKDKIIAVKQESGEPVSVIDMDLKDVVRMIRGPKGTKVTLTILREAETTTTFESTIVRDKIDIKEQAAKIQYMDHKRGEKTFKVGIIELPSFYGGMDKKGRSSSVDVRNLLTEAKEKKVNGIVLNLSRNGGGLLEEAVNISGLFIKNGAVVATKDYRQNRHVLQDQDPSIAYGGPLVVLTSRLSASASEILAGALKDYNRAVIVGGDHTFGKGSVQMVSDLPFGLGALKVTTALFFLPGGASTQRSGVTASIPLPSIYSTEDIGEQALDYALSSQTIPRFLSGDANVPDSNKGWQPVSTDTVSLLAKKSTERVKKNDKFKEILKNIEESNKNKGILKLAELRKKSIEDKKNKKDEKKKKTNKRKEEIEEQDSPYLNEAVNILVDWVESPT